jgi:exosortase
LKRIARLAPQIALAGVLAAVYGTVLVELVHDWIRDPNYSHGFLIPAVSGYFLWKNREDLGRPGASPSIWGLPGIILAMSLLVLGTAGAEVFTQRVSLILALASLVLLLRGWSHLRLVAFSLAILFLAIPLPYVVYYGLTGPMQAFATKAAVWGLNTVGVPSVAQGNIIHLPQGSLEVAEACSGIRSLYAFLAVGALVAHSMSIPSWGRILIFSLTIPLSVAGNSFRVFSSGIGTWMVGPQVTKGAIHELFGILVFAASVGVLILIKKAVGSSWPSGMSLPSSFSASPVPSPPSSVTDVRSRKDSPTSNSYPDS